MPSQFNRRVTAKDVARHAGVSATTVSLVINNVAGSNIPEKTRQRVWDAVRLLNYRPNAVARSLRTRQTHTLGLITDALASSAFAGDIILGAQQTAWRQQRLLLIVNTSGAADVQRAAFEDLVARQVEGIIYASMAHQTVDLTIPDNEATPLVLVNCQSSEKSIPAVVPDEESGGFNATRALIDMGHRKIGFVNLDPSLVEPASIGRLRGYARALTEAEIPFDPGLVKNADGDATGGYTATSNLLDAEDISAIFLATDRMAMGAYDAVRERGLSIPDDISIVGFDNQALIAHFLRPRLATVQLPFYAMGQWAVDRLLTRSNDEAVPGDVYRELPCEFVSGNSIGPAPGSRGTFVGE